MPETAPRAPLPQGLDLPFVVNDLVIQEDSCNLACEYCLTGQSQFKEDHSLLQIFDPPRPQSCEPGTELHDKLHRVLDATADQEIPVVKISGGEVMLIRGIMELISELSGRYETVVVLTNGVPLSDRRLARLQSLGNVVLQISLDSTRYRGNSYRVQSEEVHEALMTRVRRILDAHLPTEIYLVLNERSIDDLSVTCEDLAPWQDHVTLFPFPVRGPQRARFLPRRGQHERLFALLDRARSFGTLLPAEPYLQRLRRFLTEGERTFRCHLPRIAFTSFDDGAVTSCPNIWFNHVGNLLEQPSETIFRDLAASPFRRLLLSERPRIDACKACFTPWDPLSLYFEGELSLDQLGQVPVYRGERTRQLLRRIRRAFMVANGQEVRRAGAKRRSAYAG